MPEYMSNMSKLPPSVSELEQKRRRTNYRMTHWMRAILPTIDLRDLDAAQFGFMAMPGTGPTITAENVAFNWGDPEAYQSHLADTLAKIREQRKKTKKSTEEQGKCRALTKKKTRCKLNVSSDAGTDAHREHTCGHHAKYDGDLWVEDEGDRSEGEGANAGGEIQLQDVQELIAGGWGQGELGEADEDNE